MFRVQAVIAMSPGAISGENMIPLVPGLRFPSHREEQLQAENKKQETEGGDLICVGSSFHRGHRMIQDYLRNLWLNDLNLYAAN